jgi:hypothetical protein
LKKLVLGCLLLLGLPGLAQAEGQVLPEWLSTRYARAGKVLVTFNKVPATIDYEVIGPVEIYSRWFGGFGTARGLLGEKARQMGANAVVETGLWLAPSFPVPVAPHARGIAVRIPDIWDLERLADSASTWE